MQNIGVEVTPSTACLAVDSNFELSRGEGVFPGSICEVVDSVILRFYATDNLNNVHYTDPTPPIAVSGDIIIVALVIYDIEIILSLHNIYVGFAIVYRRVSCGWYLPHFC